MKNFFKISALTILLALPMSMEGQDLGTIIGIATTLGNIIRGETTVTPSYSLNSWDYYGKLIQPTGPYWTIDRDTVRLDHFVGRYFYTQYVSTSNPGSTPASSSDAFPIPSVALQNLYCNTGTLLTSVAQTYTIWVTCSVTSSGLAPPTGPYEISFKTVGTPLQKDCSLPSSSTREFRKTYMVQPYQGQVGRVGNPTYSLSWPFQCWAGDPYQF